MPRLLFFNIPTTGHINPTLLVAAELVRRGAEVIYYLPEAYRAKVTPTGAEFRPYPEIVERSFVGLDGSHPVQSLRRLAELSLAILPDILGIVKAERPDALIHDSMCGWGRLAGQISGIPTVSSLALLVTTRDLMIRAGLLPILLGNLLGGIPHIRAYMAAGREIERQYGVKMPAPPDFILNRGTITISYTTADIQPGAETLGSSFKFVGPIIEPRDDGSFPFDRLDGRPLVYISLGTLTNDRPDFYRACLRAFGGGDRQVVMVVPSKIDVRTLGDIPPNFIIRPYVPQLELFPRTALCICHAGMNTLHEALVHSVPLVLVPQQMEQRMNAFRFAEIGAGVVIRRPSPGAAELASAADRVLGDPAFKQRADFIGQGLRSAGGARRAADEILQLVRAELTAYPPSPGPSPP